MVQAEKQADMQVQTQLEKRLDMQAQMYCKPTSKSIFKPRCKAKIAKMPGTLATETTLGETEAS